MPGYHRTKSKEESTGVLTFRQKEWGGGENSDLPASVIAPNEVPLLQDMIAFDGYLEGHSGSARYSATALPGTGVVHTYKQHPVSKKWLLHRGGKLWMADAAMASWSEVVSYGASWSWLPTIPGDTGGQIGFVFLRNINASNSNAGVWQWELTNSGSTRTFSLYKDAAKLQLVARGTLVGDGILIVAQQNGSGLGGYIFVTFTGNDTDIGNTLTSPITSFSYGVDFDSTIKPFDKGFVVAAKNNADPTVRPVFVDLTDGRWRALSHQRQFGYGDVPLTGTGTQSNSTPYGYRFIFTFCRIVDASGAPAYSANRVTGNLVHESCANSYINQPGTDVIADYGEYWVANPISAGTPLTIRPTYDGTANSLPFGVDAKEYLTHYGVYRVLDVGTNGIDPANGAGNNREIYIWCGDFDITVPTWSVIKTDDELRSLYAAGFGLRTRGWREIPAGEVMEVASDFLYLASRGDNQVYYSQLGAKELAGYYQPGFQFMKLDSSIQAIAKSANMITFICNNKCWRSSPSVYKDVGVNGQAVYQLRHLVPVDGPIGVTDWSSLTEVETGTFIAHCNDHTIRTWDGLSWSKDLASRKVRKILRTITDGSAGGYFSGAFLLWYRDNSSSTYNTKCVRYGFGGDAGNGWSRLVRSTWVFPPLYAGATQCIDANGISRLVALDSVDGLFYWVETFDSYSGSGLSKAWKDKIGATAGTDITPTVLFRERIGSKESNTLRHQETHVQLRPVDEAAGYLTGFQVSISGYADGNPTAIETVANVPKTGDISFWKEHQGHRLQTGLSFTTSKFRLVGIESRDLEDDRRILGQGPFDTTEAGNQRALGATLTHWLTRYRAQVNRARGSLYTVGGSLPAFTTGPDGRAFALNFTAGQSLSQVDPTSYADFSVLFWCKSVTIGARVWRFTGATVSLSIAFDSNTILNIGGLGTVTVSNIVAGWHHFAVVRSGSTISVYQNGVLLGGTVTDPLARGNATFGINLDGAAMQIYDMRVFTSALAAAAIAYYYGDVVNNAGGKVLP
jgi:hypothetical protein